MIDRIKEGILEIRELFNEDGLGFKILFFILFLMLSMITIFVGYFIILLTYSFPKTMIPIEITLFTLWKFYSKWWEN